MRPARSQYTHATFAKWGPRVVGTLDDSLLGCWATAPIPQDFTFGIELEVVLHSVQKLSEKGQQGEVQMAHSSQMWSSMRETEAKQSVLEYLARLGVCEGWK
jgi:hypothetical protein